MRVVALDKVTEFLFFLTKILVTAGMGAATYFYFTSDKYTVEELHYVQVPVVIIMLGTYLIASVFFGVYSMAVDTLFMCFCKSNISFYRSFLNSDFFMKFSINFSVEDCERNDGSEEKPYFMSKQLMKILGKKNLVPRDQYD